MALEKGDAHPLIRRASPNGVKFLCVPDLIAAGCRLALILGPATSAALAHRLQTLDANGFGMINLKGARVGAAYVQSDGDAPHALLGQLSEGLSNGPNISHRVVTLKSLKKQAERKIQKGFGDAKQAISDVRESRKK